MKHDARDGQNTFRRHHPVIVYWPIGMYPHLRSVGTDAIAGAHHGPPDLTCAGYLRSSSGTTRGAGAGRRISTFVAALAVLGFCTDSAIAPLSARANPRTALGTKLDIIMRSGERRTEHPFGWRGISADWINADQREIPRFDVRAVCPETCPSDLVQTEVAEDTVAWKTGPRTRGYVEVSCSEYERCVVRQNGQSRPWDEVRYLQLKPSLGGCFARLIGGMPDAITVRVVSGEFASRLAQCVSARGSFLAPTSGYGSE